MVKNGIFHQRFFSVHPGFCQQIRKLLKMNTSTDLLQNAAKMMHGENTYLYALCMNQITDLKSSL